MKKYRFLKSAALTLCALLLCGAAALAAEDETLPQLDVPTELKWGVEYKYGTIDGERTLTTEEKPGMISWKEGELHQNRTRITLYRLEDGGERELFGLNHSFGASDTALYRSVSHFYYNEPNPEDSFSGPDAAVQRNTLRDGFPSGQYYFTLQALGDGVNYRDSEVVKSEIWEYVRPEARMPALEAGYWDWPKACWDDHSEDPLFGGYNVVFFSRDSDSETIRRRNSSSGDKRNYHTVPDSILSGSGSCYFQVRILSADITQACNGDWSPLSTAYALDQTAESIRDQLQTLAGQQLPDESVRAAVQALDRAELRSSMLADDETLAALDVLESSLEGAYKSVEVRDVAMDSSEIEFTGALLNPVTSEEVNLVVAPPEREDVIPTMYNNTVALRFSMTVEGLADPHALAVPVAVSMPVPENINPYFFVVLHYPVSGGAPVELRPGNGAVYFEQNGKLFVRFVLDGFSDFVITELNPSARSEDYARRAYETILGRAADEEGLAHWTSEMANGVSGGAIIDEFFRSEEYKAKGNSDDKTVRLCYQAMLSREPDEAEIANWTAMLADGYSTTRLVAEFVASPEFATICETYGLTAGSIELGPRDSNSNLTRFVERCYAFALERAADEGGLNEWCGHVLNGDVNEAGELITPERVVFGFVFSGEAQAKERDDAAFITMLYHIMLDRDPDEAGLEAWSTALADWEKNLGQDAGRQKLYAEFAAMPEFGLMLNNFTI